MCKHQYAMQQCNGRNTKGRQYASKQSGRREQTPEMLASDPQMEVTLGSCLRRSALFGATRCKRSIDTNSSLGSLQLVKPRVQLGGIRQWGDPRALRGPLVTRSLTFPQGFPRARGRRRDCDDPRPAPNTSPSQPAARGGAQSNQGRPGGRHLELRTGRKTLL